MERGVKAKSVTQSLRDAGARLLLHTFCVDVLMDGERIAGLVVASKRGLGLIKGLAVTLSAKAQVPPRELDILALQNRLRADGALFSSATVAGVAT